MTALATCDHCGQRFEVSADLTGGITNCPSCGKATRVEGLRDPLWRMWQVGGAFAVLAIAVVFLNTLGPAAAILAGIVGAGVLWIISRGF